MDVARTLRSIAACLGLMVLMAPVSAHAESATVKAVPGQPTLPIGNYDFSTFGYRVEEFFVSGTAASYKFAAPPTEDGRWSIAAAESMPYVTRYVVIRPDDPRKFNGTVVVEWLNVTGGLDVAGDWGIVHRELLRGGYAYVAVSAQKVGVEGGAGVFGPSTGFLKKVNPERYAALNHPGDGFSYDIFSDAGRVLRSAAAKTLLGPLTPKRILAIGVSQSAVFLTTYVDAIDPVAKAYDGFLVDSRFGGAAPLDGGSMIGRDLPRYAKFRSDLRVPVIATETETDLLDGGLAGYIGARTPDNARLRVWEVTGTAHADNYIIGISNVGAVDPGTEPIEKLAATFAPINAFGPVKLEKALNNAPQHHYVVEAALWHLDQWVRTGKAPPRAAQIKTTGDKAAPYVLDASGNAQGGVRSPWVDVPTERMSGVPTGTAIANALVGSAAPFDADALRRLYPGGKDDYLKKFAAALHEAVKNGFMLPADEKEALALAAASYPQP